MRCATPLVVCSWLVSIPALGFAEGFAVRRSIDLGHPARSARLAVQQSTDATTVEVDRAHAPLPIAAPERVDVESVELAQGNKIAIVRVTGAGGHEAAAIVARNQKGQAEIAWTGALDLRGDPGERTGQALLVQEPTAERAGAAVLVADVVERVHVCGQGRSPLYPKRLERTDSGLAFRPAVIERVPGPIAGELAATDHSPGPSGPPLVPALHLVGVSSHAGAATAAQLPAATGSLTDGDPKSFWTSGNPAGGHGEFATFRRDGSQFPIRALALVPRPAELPPTSPASIARTLVLVGDGGTALKVRLPQAPEAGRRYWVVPEQPLAWACLSIVLDEVAPIDPGRPGPAVFADVEAYTDLDFGPGLDRLVQELGAGGKRAGDAAQLLAELGPDVAEKLHAAWPSLPPEAHRRAVRVLARHAEVSERARDTLAIALDDADPDVRKSAFDALLPAGPHARSVLLARASRAGEQSDAIAIALARRAPKESIETLLQALSATGGVDRAALREAIALACAEGGPDVLSSVRAWSAQSGAGLAARAALALALARASSVEGAPALAAELVAADVERATEFSDRWRLVQAARALGPQPEVDAWLLALARSEERWMLRSAAIQALAERASPLSRQAATDALTKDAYPRVRTAATLALAKEAAASPVLVEHAQRDAWPMVRAAALDALAGRPGAETILAKATSDRAHVVRIAAIRALAKMGARAAWPVIEQRAVDPAEWPEVKTEAVQFARALCIPAARKALLDLVRSGIKFDSDEPTADLGIVAFEALQQIGGKEADAARRMALAPAAPAAFRAAAQAQAKRPTTCSSPER